MVDVLAYGLVVIGAVGALVYSALVWAFWS